MKSLWENVLQPTSLDEALALLRRYAGAARLVAGGTDVVVELSRGVNPTGTIIDLTSVDELQGIQAGDDGIELMALTTHNDVIASPECVRHAFPLAQACAEIGAPQLRTRATIAGNIATASPANDTISALVALDASVTLQNVDGQRTLPIESFFTGFRSTGLRDDELIRSVTIPSPAEGQRGVYRKLGLRRAQAISVIHFAIVAQFDGEVVRSVRIALGCVAPTIVRVPQAEAFLDGKRLTPDIAREAARLCRESATPIDDVRGSGAYRSRVLERSIADALMQLAAGEERRGWMEDPVLLDSGLHLANRVNDSEVLINGEAHTFSARSLKGTLLNALREDFGLTGSKEGCAEGECGACTVWLDGQAVMSCLVPASQARGHEVVTIEGLATTSGRTRHPLQEAFVERAAVQCGFCIPGMIMAGAKLLDERPKPDLDEIKVALSGNICRCTGYTKIIDAMNQAANDVQ